MSVYQWPRAEPEEFEDDAIGRTSFVRRRPDGGGAAGLRATLDRARAVGAPATTGGGPGMGAAPSSRSRLWIPLGPATLIDGSTIGRRRVTGRVRDLWVSPDGQRLYAGSAGGGVWYSGDGGSSWRSVGGFAPTRSDLDRPAHRFATGALLVLTAQPDPDDPTAPVDPDDPAHDLVLVGTGELDDHDVSKPGGEAGGVGILVARGPAVSDEVDPWTFEATELEGSGVYRFARDATTGTIYAATSRGLRQRPADGDDRDEWDDVDAEPFDDLTTTCSDVLWTPATGDEPARLWVWVSRTDQFGLWCRDGTDDSFREIVTPGARNKRGALAAADPPSTVYLFNNQGSSRPPKLYRITPDPLGDPAGQDIPGVPDMVGHQGNYDLAITVDPTDPDRVVLGGKDFDGENPEGDEFRQNAGAIFTARVEDDGTGTLRYGGSGDPTFIGGGCHSDVHALRFTPDGAQLWAASDGGVARSTNPTTTVGFVSRNDGISALESNFVASHPFCEGFVAAGQQDNGIMERRSAAVWYHRFNGDGGGLAFDPGEPDRYVYQTSAARWRASEFSRRFRRLLTRGSAPDEAAKSDRESSKSAFYANPAIIANADPARDAQLLIPTNRVWYTEDWGQNWVTLPTGTDPIGPGRYNEVQDRLGTGDNLIISCGWASTDVAWILGREELRRLSREPNSWSDGSIGRWSLDSQPLLAKGKKKSDPIEIDHWTVVAPDPSVAPDPTANPEVKGGLYLGGLGKADDEDADTLWWYDGVGRWHPTGLRASDDGTEAPITALVCDPVPTAAGPRVFVGTGVGVWEGVRSGDADDPSWTWTPLLNGLPEATVEDLSLFRSNDPSDAGSDEIALLRAAVASRGVWELRLDADVEDLTYVRAHADDLRHRARAINVRPAGQSPRSWHGSPDIAIRQAPVAAPPPTELNRRPWDQDTVLTTTSREQLQRFQAALRARMIRTDGDDRIEADGRWDDLFNEVLREFPGAEAADGSVELTKAIWEDVVKAPDHTAEPWGSGSPSEADLHDRTVRRDNERVTRTSSWARTGPKKVDVIVHHRGLQPRPGSDVRVTLLQWTRVKPDDPVPRPNDVSTWFTGDVPWTAAVNEVLNSTDGATSETFANGWEFVDEVTPRRELTIPQLDNLTTGVVTFDLDLSNYIGNTVMLLAAVVRAGDDLTLGPDTLSELVMTNPAVAARSLLIRR